MISLFTGKSNESGAKQRMVKRILLGVFNCLLFLGSLCLGFSFALSQAMKDAEVKYPGGSAILSQEPDPIYHTLCISSPWTSEFNNASQKHMWYIPVSGLAGIFVCGVISSLINRRQ